MDPLSSLRSAVRPLTGDADDDDELLEWIGGATIVLLGEASHGTHEFYHERARITRRLVEEKGFDIVAVEADWPDAYRANRYVRGEGSDASAEEALGDFRRFPTWMWRNAEIVRLLEWLRRHNAGPGGARAQVGFYGLDLYSMSASVEAVIRYLDEVDPEAAARARYRYSCFEDFGEDSQAYGYAAEMGLTQSCEDEAVQQLVEMQRRAGELIAGGSGTADEHFFAEQNARLVRNAEEYYRTMFRGRVSSWNLRDSHMVETLEALLEHSAARRGPARAVVWAHNSHLGDARATQMGAAGEWNVGQLVREAHGSAAFLLGFTTYGGSVTAASDWDRPAQRRTVRPALPGSWEALFHEVGAPRFLLDLREKGEPAGVAGSRLERAIGVIYRPETERVSHYFDARLADQFDAVLHIDRTSALEPLEPGPTWHAGEEAPETFPFGL